MTPAPRRPSRPPDRNRVRIETMPLRQFLLAALATLISVSTLLALESTLEVTDASGNPWVSMFVMEQQDGRWFVKGVSAKQVTAQKL